MRVEQIALHFWAAPIGMEQLCGRRQGSDSSRKDENKATDQQTALCQFARKQRSSLQQIEQNPLHKRIPEVVTELGERPPARGATLVLTAAA